MDVFEVLADPHRRAILLLLRQGPMTAGAIGKRFAVSRPAVSRHLRHLRNAGLVSVQVNGREREYRLAAGQLEQMRSWLRNFEPRVPESALDALETEVYRTRRDHRRATAGSESRAEETA